MSSRWIVSIVFAGALFADTVFVHPAMGQCGDHADLFVGRTASGQLKIVGDGLSATLLICPVDGVLKGFTSAEPGFNAVAANEPDNDFFTLASGVTVRIEAVSLDPAFKAWGPGLASLIDEPGDRILLGGASLHTHVTWHVDSLDTAFDPDRPDWKGTFILVDTGSTGFTASAAFTLTFAPEQLEEVPTVSEWGMIVLGLSILCAATILLRNAGREGPRQTERA